MQPGEKVFQDDKVGSDKDTSKPKAASSSALEEGTINTNSNTGILGGGENDEQSLLPPMGNEYSHKKKAEFCTSFCISRSLGIWCLALGMVIVGYILWSVSPFLGVILGIIAPPILWMSYAIYCFFHAFDASNTLFYKRSFLCLKKFSPPSGGKHDLENGTQTKS